MKNTKKHHIITTPTDDRRHCSVIRFGKLSHEIFAKKPERRRELGLPVYDPEKEGN